MKIKAIILGSVLALCFLANGAMAADKLGRFTLKPIDGGFLRLDTKTGAISTCRGKQGHMICRMTPDDRAVLQSEIDRLQGKNDKLHKKFARSGRPQKDSKLRVQLPGRQDFERIAKDFDRMVKQFFKFSSRMRKKLGDKTKDLL